MTKIGRPSLWEEHQDEWVRLYCDEQRSRGEIAREYGTSVQTVTRQLVSAGVSLEPRKGTNPNAGRTPERQAQINAKVSAGRTGKGLGPRVEHEEHVCQNSRCAKQYIYRPGHSGKLYCSKQCQMSVQGQRTAAEARVEYEKYPRRCPCGEAVPYEHRHTRYYCSAAHRQEYQAKRVADPDNHVTFNCQNCDTEVTRRKGFGYQKYCSNACAAKHTKVKKHYTVDGTTVLDSTWEVLFWGLCGFSKISIERFEREDGVSWKDQGWYAPDFWLPVLEVAIEVKGRERGHDRTKWEVFNQRLIVVGREELDMLRKAGNVARAIQGLVQSGDDVCSR